MPRLARAELALDDVQRHAFASHPTAWACRSGEHAELDTGGTLFFDNDDPKWVSRLNGVQVD